MTTLYVYNTDSMRLIARINGDSNQTCEQSAANLYGDDYGWTYTPAFGATDGLIDTDTAVEIEA